MTSDGGIGLLANATSSNTANAIVLRDGSGGFTAGKIAVAHGFGVAP